MKREKKFFAVRVATSIHPLGTAYIEWIGDEQWCNMNREERMDFMLREACTRIRVDHKDPMRQITFTLQGKNKRNQPIDCISDVPSWDIMKNCFVGSLIDVGLLAHKSEGN